VADQRRDPKSQLNWMERMISTRKECPEFGVGSWHPVETGTDAVFALRFEARGGAVVAVHNLTSDSQQVKLALDPGELDACSQLFSEEDGEDVAGREAFELPPYGYRWLRVGEPGVRATRPPGVE
jgi:maltose alpha-D-glucosyltransferase/alpha-amylase